MIFSRDIANAQFTNSHARHYQNYYYIALATKRYIFHCHHTRTHTLTSIHTSTQSTLRYCQFNAQRDANKIQFTFLSLDSI